MSQAATIEFNTTQADIERLRCSACKGYLSCAPIRLLHDGSNICGRCSPFNDDTTYRQLTLEAILSNATFPCPYAKYGCTGRLLFGSIADHETKCEHRPLTCLSLPYTTCLWKGPAMQLAEHFAKQHPRFFEHDAEFILEVNKNKEGLLLVLKNGNVFIVKYLYDAGKNNLMYDIRYFVNAEEEFCKIKLTNLLETDYVIQCKGSKCMPYKENFYDMPNPTVLHINNFLKNLNDPTTITVGFNLNSTLITKHLAVNYDIIEANKCKMCQYYLIPPIYDNKDDIVCSDCSCTYDGCKPSKDKTLNNLLALQNYPCRWRKCDFVGKADGIRSHEFQCSFRTYRCVISECKAICIKTTLVQHLEIHKYITFVDKLVYKINFGRNPDINCLFTIINNEIVTMEYGMYSYHYLSLQVCTNPEQFAATLYFEHSHCKCKSKKFSIGDKQLRVYLTDLPSCFKKEDDMTVTLTIE